MVALVIKTVSGLPAFRLTVSPTDSIGDVTKAAAKKANIGKSICRLSLGIRGTHSWLNYKDSVEALGLKDGAIIMLHVKNTPLIKNINRPPPLAVHSFASSGYAFFVDVVTPRGRHIFRPRLAWHDDVGALLEATAKRASCKSIVVKYKRLDGSTVKLEKGHKVSEYGLGQDDTLYVHGIPGEEAPKPPPLSRFDSGSFSNLSADSPRSRARPGSAGSLMSASGGSPWVPTGPTNWP